MNDTISGDRSEPRKTHDVDTGFAWIVLIGSFMVNLLLLGSAKAFGVLYTEMVEYYSSGSGNTAWIGTIAIILMFSLGPVANYLCQIYTIRRIAMIGGNLLGLGHFLSGFITKMEYMYLTFLISGWLYDVYGNWHVSFMLTGCMYILAGVTILLEPIVVRCCTRTGNKESSSPKNLQRRQIQGGPTDGACKDDVESSDTSFTYKF